MNIFAPNSSSEVFGDGEKLRVTCWKSLELGDLQPNYIGPWN